MTLIEARIHGDQITLVADTKLTLPDIRPGAHRTNLRVLDYPVMKLAIVRGDLAVAVAGDWPKEGLQLAAAHWHMAPEGGLLEALRAHTIKEPGTAFVVAALDPPRLWQMADGLVYQRTEHRNAWEGDVTAHERFVESSRQFEEIGMEDPFCMMAAMHDLTQPFVGPAHPTVGGHAIRVSTSAGAFCYVPDGSSRLAETPGNNVFFSLEYAVGCGPTPGAYGCFVAGARKQILFRHQQPWDPVQIDAATIPELITAALDEHDQYLKAAVPLIDSH